MVAACSFVKFCPLPSGCMFHPRKRYPDLRRELPEVLLVLRVGLPGMLVTVSVALPRRISAEGLVDTLLVG